MGLFNSPYNQEEFDEDDFAPSFRERRRQRRIQKRLEQLEAMENNDDFDEAIAMSFGERMRQRKIQKRLEKIEAMENNDDFDDESIMSFKERRRQRRLEKRMKQIESGKEPSVPAFIAMRAMELLIPEVIISVIMSVLITTGLLPSIFYVGFALMGVSWLGYIIYAGITSQHMFWAIRNVGTYLAVNLGGYAAVVIASVIFRMIDIEPYSWLFLPMKLFTLFGISAWTSLWITHTVIVAVMLAILINIKLDRLHELDDEGEEI